MQEIRKGPMSFLSLANSGLDQIIGLFLQMPERCKEANEYEITQALGLSEQWNLQIILPHLHVGVWDCARKRAACGPVRFLLSRNLEKQ